MKGFFGMNLDMILMVLKFGNQFEYWLLNSTFATQKHINAFLKTKNSEYIKLQNCFC